jgi:hypothetical protein
MVNSTLRMAKRIIKSELAIMIISIGGCQPIQKKWATNKESVAAYQKAYVTAVERYYKSPLIPLMDIPPRPPPPT